MNWHFTTDRIQTLLTGTAGISTTVAADQVLTAAPIDLTELSRVLVNLVIGLITVVQLFRTRREKPQIVVSDKILVKEAQNVITPTKLPDPTQTHTKTD